jgi:hypothetical protein
MLSETERDSLSDILFNIDLANSFAQGFDYERFLTDMRTFYAITRCLEIISEASRRLSFGNEGAPSRDPLAQGVRLRQHLPARVRGRGPSPCMGHRA